MEFSIIVQNKLNNETNVSVFNKFFLQEKTTGNCFPCDHNFGNGYLVGKVRLDQWKQEVIDGELKSFGSSLENFENAIAYAKTLKD